MVSCTTFVVAGSPALPLALPSALPLALALALPPALPVTLPVPGLVAFAAPLAARVRALACLAARVDAFLAAPDLLLPPRDTPLWESPWRALSRDLMSTPRISSRSHTSFGPNTAPSVPVMTTRARADLSAYLPSTQQTGEQGCCYPAMQYHHGKSRHAPGATQRRLLGDGRSGEATKQQPAQRGVVRGQGDGAALIVPVGGGTDNTDAAGPGEHAEAQGESRTQPRTRRALRATGMR